MDLREQRTGPPAVRVDREPPLAWVTIDRPKAHNALDIAGWSELATAVEELGADHEVRVVVVRGAGEEAFVSGADIRELLSEDGEATGALRYDALAERVWRALRDPGHAAIAMVNGLCFGGGVLIAIACDMRIASANARFAIPAGRLGLAYPMHGIEALVSAVGPGAAADLLLGGRRFDAAEALRTRLVDRVVAPEALEEEVRATAGMIAALAPMSVRAHKMAIDAARFADVELREEAVAAADACLTSEDHREGVRAFLERREPRFGNR